MQVLGFHLSVSTKTQTVPVRFSQHSDIRGLQILQVHIDILPQDTGWYPVVPGPHPVPVHLGCPGVLAPLMLREGLVQVVATRAKVGWLVRVLAVQVQRHLLLVIARLRAHRVRVYRVLVQGVVRLLTVPSGNSDSKELCH